MGIFAANQNGDAGAHTRSAPQSSVKFRGPQKNIQQLSPLQIIEKFRAASDVRRFAHALFQEAAGQFSVLAVEMRIVNLRRDGLEMPVGPGQEVRAAHLALIERSHGGFGTRFGGAFEGHVDSRKDADRKSLNHMYSKEEGDQNGAKACLLE